MKNFKLPVYILVASLIAFTSCKKNNEKSDLDKQKEAISTTWQVETITAGSDDVQFERPVVINFSTNGNYSIENLESLNAANLNHDEVLANSGTWEITEDNLQLVRLGGGNSVTITQLDEANFKFTYASSYPKTTDESRNISISTIRSN